VVEQQQAPVVAAQRHGMHDRKREARDGSHLGSFAMAE